MNESGKIVRVGISDLNIAKAPDTIRTLGLGSCVGIVIYDLTVQIAGLAHIMLPDSTTSNEKEINKHKYADTAIKLLIEMLVENKARKHVLKAKIAGGAQMFQFNTESEAMRIGPRNIEAVTQILEKKRIPIVASDVGGNNGRTIEFDPSTGDLYIRTVNEGESII